MGKMSRDKGANAERELARVLQGYGYETVKRGKVFYHESDLVGLPGIHPEVKRVEHLDIEKALLQAETEAAIRNDGLPVVFHRKNRQPWSVAMKWMFFQEMVHVGCTENTAEATIHMSLEDWVHFYAEWRAWYAEGD